MCLPVLTLCCCAVHTALCATNHFICLHRLSSNNLTGLIDTRQVEQAKQARSAVLLGMDVRHMLSTSHLETEGQIQKQTASTGSNCCA